MKSVGGLGTVAIVLAFATPASAATTYTVDPNKATAGCTGTTCKTIDDAAALAAASGDTIQLLPGFHVTPAPFTKQFTLTGFGAGPAVIIGPVTFSADGTLRRVAVTATGNNPAVRVSVAAAASRTVTIESSILSGAGTGAGIEGAAPALASIAVTGRHLTIADSGGAPATNLTNPGVGATASATLTNSIVLGATPGNAPSLPGSDTDGSAGHRAALFANPAEENFLLRVLSPAIDQGGGPAGGESTDDVEGDARTGTWDRGADEFVNHAPPAPGLVATKPIAAPGEEVTFGAINGPQPDADRGDGVAKYRFDFGDGTGVVETTNQVVGHTYAAPGQYAATARVVDIPGAESPPSNAVTTTVVVGGAGGAGGGGRGPDVAAPSLSITSPRAGQRIKRGKRAPVLRGRSADASGVKTIELALRRLEGRRCRWYDGRRSFVFGPCGTPRFFRAVVNDFNWSYTFPRAVVPGLGSYELRARASDRLGNRTTAVSAQAKTLAGFRIVR